MKLYLAGKWGARDELRKKIDHLRQMGIEITHDWTFNDPNNGKIQSAVDDIHGIKNADFVVAVMDDPVYSYRGTFCEIGCALGLGKNVYIYSPEPKKSEWYKVCFAHHPLVMIVEDWDLLLRNINA